MIRISLKNSVRRLRLNRSRLADLFVALEYSLKSSAISEKLTLAVSSMSKNLFSLICAFTLPRRIWASVLLGSTALQ